MIYADFEVDTRDGRPIRKQLIAKRTTAGFELYWQDMDAWYQYKIKEGGNELFRRVFPKNGGNRSL